MSAREADLRFGSSHEDRVSPASTRAIIATLKAAVNDPAAIHIKTRVWPGVEFIAAQFAVGGKALLPSVGSHVISLKTAGSASVSSHGGGSLHETTMPTGGTLIHGASEALEYQWPATSRMIFVALTPAFVDAAARSSRLGAYTQRDSVIVRDAVIEHLALILAEEASRRECPSQLALIRSVATATAYRVLAWRDAPLAPPRPLVRGALRTHAFDRVCRYVDENLGARITLADLASVAGMSRFNFARQFRRRTGESPMGYVLRKRVERARVMLRHADLKICDVAAELGFCDQSHFTRVFRRIVGVLPSDFSRHQGGPPLRVSQPCGPSLPISQPASSA